ncbi:MAG: stage IV sporulation protein A [Clostridia bacterium]|nr:stage IV sporulation protein A [Clostridia bacterium]
MENFSIYKDINERTGGDIYVGVVGPVRCGKSTFISNFMQCLVVPNIKNRHAKERTIDELPQSADGLTIMTTQPKFVPSEAVKINVANAEMKVRMIDSVGYLIAGAMGHKEDDKPRLVKTPWTDKEIPFSEAAELGTKKIMTDHSTIGIVMTSDGSVNDIPRSSYVEAEEQVVAEMQKTGKPFIIVINTTKPKSESVETLRAGLEAKYDVSVLAMDVKKLEKEDIEEIFEKVLLEFPIRTLKVDLPEWMQALPYENEMIGNILAEIRAFCEDISKVGQIDKNAVLFAQSEDFEPIGIDKINLGEGSASIKIQAKPQLFYKVLSEQCGEEIRDDFHLVSLIRELAYARREYKKIEEALAQVEQTGYGVVTPTAEEMVLDDPQIVKQGGRYGVKIRASAPSLHIMKVDVETELSPIVGSQAQSEEMVKFLASEFEENPENVWNTNMFGKSLYSMVNDGIKSKIVLMPAEAQQKMRKTLTRIVNEGKGGVICILL